MNRPLGKRQLATLENLGPSRVPVCVATEHRALIARGLLDDGGKGSFPCLTPAGLRAFADAIESGALRPIRERAIERYRNDR
jgi:hypothetical protein